MVDPNRESLADGLRLAREKRLEDRLLAVVGKAEALPIPDASVDLLVSRGSIFFWDGDGAMDLVESRTNQPGVNVFKQALANLKPVVEVKSRRVGGATYQVPVEVRPERRTALAMRWLISFSRERNEKSMSEKLAAEVIAASKGEGNAVKKKEDTHRMAEANKAFAHYRW